MGFIYIKAPIKRVAIGVIISFFMVFSTAVWADESSQASMGPALWKMENGDSTLYLFGSFHMLRKGVNWRKPYITSAIDSSDDIILEASEADIKPEQLQLLMRSQAFYTPPENLDMYLDDMVMERMLLLMQDMEIPISMINQFKPWYASSLIAIHHAIKNGFLPEHGVEAILTKQANERGVAVYGLESAYEQISALSSYSNELQTLMLEQVIEDIEGLPELYDGLMTAWMTGNEEEMAELMVDEMKKFPQVFDRIYTKRNQNWVAPLVEYLNQPGVHFVTVGTAHLVGEGSVIELLQVEGYEAERQ